METNLSNLELKEINNLLEKNQMEKEAEILLNHMFKNSARINKSSLKRKGITEGKLEEIKIQLREVLKDYASV